MVEPAIVTLSCPKCGGQVKGVIATDQDQTIACTYCGTDLHIPKIGGDVVHERVVVVEPPAAATPAPAAPPAQWASPDLSTSWNDLPDASDVSPSPRLSRVGLVLAVVVFFAIVAVFLMLRRSAESQQLMDRQRDQARELCKRTCAQTCSENVNAYQSVPHGPREKDDDPEMREVMEQVNRQLDDSDRMDCDMTCETKKCDSL